MANQKSEFHPARTRVHLTSGEVIRMLRELKEWTQGELASRTGISATNLSALENDRIQIGKHRAEQLAQAFGIHPAIIMFPEYDVSDLLKAA
ncbi:MAG: helix-turn-helix domain-containing protein [Pyrinomonadaceae bacterium]